ncbi:Energy-conserving hydrogenase (ferredoxin), subunit A [Dehalobacter sp. UNSWDHB]|jgi:NADH:ubiquinone oxidoreductase subunit 5 (chain L)/Multisubunit Na+/H+ antiporter, MnhA subunit|uniref:NADH-quinone oxidoreductase subunit 5 family protein n=1 Tax=unclassified Dehalobacter TaxID=2635733 RepID=UPI00028B53D1|nr:MULTISPECIES: proton-conducting transporter membrane subunit [unclassified Dehalobacter]AFV03254.1 Energy-conserving hydrogenase (ferredoxin), subunit A [Dehalobacter sp. DCA]AFV06240.1 Energy-conserving hydrogenase (ferredoxin), subunit A [Dehalobacter sp. CF]EQB21008.1 Energy-conserving hydrogenase (ferredoxin), subunit A [Dehalobacter sp. UNSWDHB]
MNTLLTTMIGLIVFPLIVAILLLVFGWYPARRVIVQLSTIVIALGTVYLTVQGLSKGSVFFPFASEPTGQIMLGIEGLIALFIIYMGIRYKKYLASVLALLQEGLMFYFELTYGHNLHADNNLFIDEFSIIMALIIGIIGGLICIYSIRYMKDYHHHNPDVPNRTPFFFFVMFVFLAAMFGLVFANNLIWLYFFWEITTLCSFLLIGYSKTVIAMNNSFRAIIMNLIGGLGFAIAIVFLATQADVIELNKLQGVAQALILLPAALLSFAGITKSAQMPFSSWLLGAMVAPTPTSALLHSSTMVKAGVYLIIRLSPVLLGTNVGLMVALVGAFTFLTASCLAIAQDESKRVLAYSTVANLGLIVACAGIGTAELVWAAIMLVIFHAVAKSLLFLAVGSVEHKIGDRNIEIMDSLITKVPTLAIMIVIGIFGMFLAPFGMLISKWAALEGLIKANALLTVFIAFGSAATVLFWGKWLGKIVMVKQKPQDFDSKVPRLEKYSLGILAFLTIAVCVLFPFISTKFIIPFLNSTNTIISQGNIFIMLIMMVMIILMPLSLWFYKDVHYTGIYMGGANAGKESYYGAMHVDRELSMRSLYLANYFGEHRLNKIAIGLSTTLIILMIGVVAL